MTSIFNTPHGEMQQFVQNLHNGGFTYEDIRRVIKKPSLASGFHELVNPPLEFNPPTWWRTAEQQLERARQLWPDAVLPEPPAQFVPQTTSEVLLLHVPDTFDNLSDKVKGPSGYVMYVSEHFKTDYRHLRVNPNAGNFTEPVWLAFDFSRNITVRRFDMIGVTYGVASEVLSMLIQFPDWPLAWAEDATGMPLKGYWSRDDSEDMWTEGVYLVVNKERHSIEVFWTDFPMTTVL